MAITGRRHVFYFVTLEIDSSSVLNGPLLVVIHSKTRGKLF